MSTAAVTYTFVPETTILSAEANTNFSDLVTFLNTDVMHRDASSAFTAIPSGPASDPSTANQLSRKAYVDAQILANKMFVGGDSVINALDGGTDANPFTQAITWQAGNRTGLTNGDGDVSVTFPDAFANGLLLVIACAQSRSESAHYVVGDYELTGFAARMYRGTSAVGSGQSASFNWIALGW